MREQGRSITRIASLPHAKLAHMSAPGPTGERQSVAGARRRLFRCLDNLTIKGQLVICQKNAPTRGCQTGVRQPPMDWSRF